MNQVQGSVTVNIKEYFHACMVRVSFRFTSCHFQFLSSNFYYLTSLHGLQDVENHCSHLRDIELQMGRKIPYLRFPHVLFSI